MIKNGPHKTDVSTLRRGDWSALTMAQMELALSVFINCSRAPWCLSPGNRHTLREVLGGPRGGAQTHTYETRISRNRTEHPQKTAQNLPCVAKGMRTYLHTAIYTPAQRHKHKYHTSQNTHTHLPLTLLFMPNLSAHKWLRKKS